MRALVIGSAEGVHEDVAEVLQLFTPDAVFAINDQIRDWDGPIDYACTLHPDKLNPWLKGRAEKQKYPPIVWTHKSHKLADQHTKDWAGSSGLFAVKVALLEGFLWIVVAGVRIEPTNHYHTPDKPWDEYKDFRAGWSNHRQEIAPYVRSMSGWTAELLTKPTKEWLGRKPPKFILR